MPALPGGWPCWHRAKHHLPNLFNQESLAPTQPTGASRTTGHDGEGSDPLKEKNLSNHDSIPKFFTRSRATHTKRGQGKHAKGRNRGGYIKTDFEESLLCTFSKRHCLLNVTPPLSNSSVSGNHVAVLQLCLTVRVSLRKEITRTRNYSVLKRGCEFSAPSPKSRISSVTPGKFLAHLLSISGLRLALIRA